MNKIPRYNEYKVLFYRIGLVYLFYMIARILFYFYNQDLIKIDGFSNFIELCYHGLVFDTTSILYINLLFIVFSILPFVHNTKVGYQKFLAVLYFVPNLIGFATNFIDFIYYRFNFGRSTIAALDSLEHESNKGLLLINFLVNYWHVFVLYFVLIFLWLFLYKKVKVNPIQDLKKAKYFVGSTVMFLFISTMAIGGIRGDFKKSTRPINLIDASRYVTNSAQADVILNTPFAIIRTMFSDSFKKVYLVDKKVIDSLIVPIKHYKNNPKTKPNIVLIILESNSREYFGCFNKNTTLPNYKSYTPFVDSLAQHSLVLANAYANGYKSIHAVSSVLAGIPSFKDAFTSSPYPKQKTESLVSILKSEGYTTSFFHGAPNGSMGFLGYTKILGVENYYGMTEYNKDEDFDGVWGIWDEPFFQFFNKTLSKTKQPFFSTLFSVTSHEPYKVPSKYKGKFPVGDINIHESIGYTDYSLRQFFKAASKEKWFNNTIFVFVGDHGNSIYYDEYKKVFMKNAVAMMIYRPDGKFKGYNTDLSQQIDLYPTILDMIGYDKPFRSWGRSLISKSSVTPFVVKYSDNQYMFMDGNYICTFDGKKAVGFYAMKDKAAEHNLIQNRNKEMDAIELRCQAFIQDYMERIIDKKLTSEN